GMVTAMLKKPVSKWMMRDCVSCPVGGGTIQTFVFSMGDVGEASELIESSGEASAHVSGGSSGTRDWRSRTKSLARSGTMHSPVVASGCSSMVKPLDTPATTKLSPAWIS